MLAQVKAQGVEPVGPNGLLNQLTKRVPETALEEEMSAHLGYEKHDPLGRDLGNSQWGSGEDGADRDRAGGDRCCARHG